MISKFKNIKFNGADLLAILTPLLLIVPNIALDITETYMSFTARVLNIIVPLSLYGLLVTLARRIGNSVLWMIPFMVLAAFQIVLLYLYGESIIAVDMFLNVATTSFDEATDLLANLKMAIFAVCVLYLPLIVSAIILKVKKRSMTQPLRTRMRNVSAIVFVLGAIGTCCYTFASSEYEPTAQLFPLNVIDNASTACTRMSQTAHYGETSHDFCYNAHCTHDDCDREIYVMVIGETSRADHWQLNGYDRPTNPRLSKRQNVVAFNHAISQSNTTHKSVPMLMSAACATEFDSIYNYKSIITAFKEAGFKTMFISNQPPNRSYNQFFGEEADIVRYAESADGTHPHDGQLVEMVSEELAKTDADKIFIVLHTYGSHFVYSERYPTEYAEFLPDGPTEASAVNRPVLVNAYDNTILYTDACLDNLIGLLAERHCPAALIYASDHGEDIYDDDRERFLHASPTPTYYQLHTAMLSWVSDEYDNSYPDKLPTLASHSDEYTSASVSLFDTMIDLAGIDTPYHKDEASLASANYSRPTPVYLTDRNEVVPLEKSGLKTVDISKLHKLGIL